MRIQKGSTNRCGIFLFYDRDGVVDDYVIYLLKAIRPHLKTLLVVCNGPVTEEGHKKLESVSTEVLVRKNEGFDVGGYREGIFHIGLDKLAEYDEMIMFNYTFFGPLYPFSEMFDKMDQMDLDFWGITKHHKVDPDPFKANQFGYLPEHIQSHFLVLRRSLVQSRDYIDFITNFKNPTSYLESICGYESVFTKIFEDKGYKWDVYVNTDEYEGYAYCPIMFYLKEMIEEKRCPIIKRRSFFTDYHDFLLNTCGEPSIEAYDYIRENTDYDLNLIWDNLLRLQNMTEIHRAMHFNYMLSAEESEEVEIKDTAIVYYIESAKHLQMYAHYFALVPDTVDCYVVCNDQSTCTGELLGGCGLQQAKMAGQMSYNEMLRWLDTQKKQYRYIGVMKVSDVEKYKPYSNAASWQYRDWENLSGSGDLVCNIIDCFEKNPRLGILIPPIPNHGDILPMIGYGWMDRFDEVSRLLNRYVPGIGHNKENKPLAPYGGSFWIRTDAWNEKTEIYAECDEAVALMALPFMVQDRGYYAGVVYNNDYASIEVTNLDYTMRELNKVVFEKYGPNYHKVVVDRIKNDAFEHHTAVSSVKQRLVSKINVVMKKCFPKKLYYFIEKIYIKHRGWG